MTPNDFATQCARLDLNPEALATLCKVDESEAASWLAGVTEPSPHALEMTYLLSDYAERVVDCIKVDCRAQAAQADYSGAPRYFAVTYRTDAEFQRAHPHLPMMSARTHLALMERISAELAAEGLISHLVMFNPFAYSHWLNGRDDTPERRIEWAMQAQRPYDA